MRVLTLHQPWASLVAVGAKCFETRSWRTHYRGELAIHAGALEHSIGWWKTLGDARPELLQALAACPAATGSFLKHIVFFGSSV